ncbi:MAG: inositol-3-phosphate synthase [Pirellulales bacterium]
MIVVNLASTEPPIDPASLPGSWGQLDAQLDGGDCQLPASSLYAIAALELGYPYLNFTPSLGSTPEAIFESARLRNTCHMRRDGKTGEALLKSTLEPMFAKLPDAGRHRYVQSLGDWKTAWDHVHFRGFLGTPMVFQFIWQGCDSLLAVPLLLDLVRFPQRARRDCATGEPTFLLSFFKSPLGNSEHDFGRQFQALVDLGARGRVVASFQRAHTRAPAEARTLPHELDVARRALVGRAFIRRGHHRLVARAGAKMNSTPRAFLKTCAFGLKSRSAPVERFFHMKRCIHANSY